MLSKFISILKVSIQLRQIIMKHLKTIIEVCRLTLNKIISSPKYYALPLLALMLFVRKILQNSVNSASAQQILRTSLSEFLRKLQKGSISKVLVKQNKLFFLDKNNSLYKTTHSLFPKSQLFDRLIKGKVQFQTIGSSFNVQKFITILLASALITFLWTYFYSGFFTKKVTTVQKNTSSFKDIVGLDQCKVALKQVIQFMKDPQSFKQLGARMRKGIIFYGPSGTGKTSLAKACAGEANVPFYSTNAAEFRQMYVGMGAKKVRELFKKAQQNAPSIIYIDQIDAMGNRSGGFMQNYDGAASQKNTTINQLLSQMDGFSSNESVLVIGSTNKLDLLDQSLLRPGRFDLKIKINLPNQKDRFEILSHYLQNKKHMLSQSFIKQKTLNLKGWSGAQLENLANEAVYMALRRKNPSIQQQDIENALKGLL